MKKPRAKKAKPRCANCGDETTFPKNGDANRERVGWCVPCFKIRRDGVVRKSTGEERVGADGLPVFKDYRTIYPRNPYAGGHGPPEDKDE